MSFTPIERARIDADLTVEEVAQRLNLSPKYYRQIERQGNASLKIARRLAKLFRCPGNIFLYSPAYVSKLQLGQRSGQPDRLHTPPATAGGDTGASRASRRYRKRGTPILTLVDAPDPTHCVKG